MTPLSADPSAARARLTSAGFFETALARRLQAAPIGLIDIGARWGVTEMFAPIDRLCNAVAVEADPVEAARLREHPGTWAGHEVLDAALDRRAGRTPLYVTRRSNNSSIFPVDERYAHRYGLAGFELEREIAVETVSLDESVASGRLRTARAGELLKLDTQGSELRILEGAERMLEAHSVCVVCEVSFFSVYQGATLFSEVELFMRGRGFACYGLLDAQERSTRRTDKRRSLGRERLMQADAVFLRDPFEPGHLGALPQRHGDVLFVAALLLGYFDLCLELSDAAWASNDGPALRAVVERFAAADPQGAIADAEALMAAVRQSASPNVEIGRFVDLRRDFHSFHDVRDQAPDKA